VLVFVERLAEVCSAKVCDKLGRLISDDGQDLCDRSGQVLWSPNQAIICRIHSICWVFAILLAVFWQQ
jgi:hypothetical protein